MRSILTWLGLAVTAAFSQQADFPRLSGPYLGQTPPGTVPVQFGAGIIDTDERIFAITFSPDGRECFYTKSLATNVIMTTRELGGSWTKPTIADFSGKVFDLEPHIAPDGARMIFGSMRPLPGAGTRSDLHQWITEKKSGTWTEPQPMGSPFNDRFCMYVSVVNNGNIYFTGEDGIYVSKFMDGKYWNPVKLGDTINRLQYAAHPFVAPDESYLIYDAQPEEGNADLFISFRKKDNTWGQSVSLGEMFNTDKEDMTAFVSRDGKYLFFSRLSPGKGDIYWVDARVIEEIKAR